MIKEELLDALKVAANMSDPRQYGAGYLQILFRLAWEEITGKKMGES